MGISYFVLLSFIIFLLLNIWLVNNLINQFLWTRGKAGERQPRAPGQIGEHAPPVPLDSHADGHIKVYF
jgi:hypothetical protein